VCIGEYDYSVGVSATSWQIISGGVFVNHPAPQAEVRRISWQTPGLHRVVVGCSSQAGSYSKTLDVLVINSPSIPKPSPITYSYSLICPGEQRTYSVTPVTGVSYVWKIFKNNIEITNLPTIINNNQFSVTWNESGSYSIYCSFYNGSCYSDEVFAGAVVLGSSSLSIAAAYSNYCPNTQAEFYVTGGIPQDSYVWAISSGGVLTQSGGRAYVTWTTLGNHTVSVYPSNICFPSGPIASKTITVGNPPVIGPIIAPQKSCANLEQVYYVESVPEATSYSWQTNPLPTGSSLNLTSTHKNYQPIKHPSSGNWNVDVTVTNQYCSSRSSLTVSVNGNIPSTPGPDPISGPNSFCVGSSQDYIASPDSPYLNWKTFDGTLTSSPYPSLVNVSYPTTGSKTLIVNETQPGYCTSPSQIKNLNISNPYLNQNLYFSFNFYTNFAQSPMTITSSSSSGIPVTYTSSNTSVATISGNVIRSHLKNSKISLLG
jgi:hypothetical protein